MHRAITSIEGISVGSCEDLGALTGCTVILAGAEGAVCGVDVRGSAPGTRETDLLHPVNLVERVHAVLLTGGSAYGLDAACGVMDYLEENRIGYSMGPTVVPIVPAAVLFDLPVGDYRVRPDRAMGYQACQKAGKLVKEGNVGAGAGATVGKFKGYEFCTKSGLGTWSINLSSGLIVGAIAAVNALGDVLDEQGNIIAGLRNQQGGFAGTLSVWKEAGNPKTLHPGQNTTIAVVASNAALNKNQATKVAQMAQNGLARVISPTHTMYDGDTVFALATGQLEVDVNLVGELSAEVLAQAIIRAIQNTSTIQGYRAWND